MICTNNRQVSIKKERKKKEKKKKKKKKKKKDNNDNNDNDDTTTTTTTTTTNNNNNDDDDDDDDDINCPTSFLAFCEDFFFLFSQEAHVKAFSFCTFSTFMSLFRQQDISYTYIVSQIKSGFSMSCLIHFF